MSLDSAAIEIEKRYEHISASLMQSSLLPIDEMVKLNQEYATLEPVVAVIRERRNLQRMNEEIDAELSVTNDSEFKEALQSEKALLSQKLEKIEHDFMLLLIPKDTDDEKGVIMEIRAAAGGAEAALFAYDLMRMYCRYAERQSWKVEILSMSSTGIDGVKECAICISGRGAFARLKFEAGVHRVQRVPDTENNGRIHTSTVTVAVLPEIQEVDINIKEEDLKIDVYRASGAGGQHVNKTESAVRIVHIPTGITVCQQDDKSQHRNKDKAMRILSARLYELEKSKKESERSQNRKAQVGTGERSEKVRTYNYPQSRVTDHRIGVTIHNILDVMDGNIQNFIDHLISLHNAEKLANFSEKEL
ncbi:Peptide chain release factor 1 [Candidatus Fokinia solitaria]|uniref:Peptide chain release factor 1 n=1 Tax=Candidatus Fokinia solitaria TaxID=1802984 RepID=A0A2U8BRM2_9RICK|nr:peptide chain release factor 1 [Candidatus Fokinia solitaria]AWD32978.1 Peptide chain release factor 1 [Candidatus Fokinia solitaria]